MDNKPNKLFIYLIYYVYNNGEISLNYSKFKSDKADDVQLTQTIIFTVKINNHQIVGFNEE